MANNHRYGFRFVRNLWGGDTPEVVECPIASGYQPNNGAVDCNLNPGDPVTRLESGAVQLAVAGSGAATTTERVYGIFMGCKRVLIQGGIRPSNFYPGGTVYGTALAPYTLQTMAIVMPVVGKEFEIDTAAAGGTSFDTYEEFQGLGGSAVANFSYSALDSGTSNVKANPLLDLTTVSEAVADDGRQLRIMGIGRLDDKQDFTLANVSLRVVFNAVQESPFVTTAGQDGS